MTKCRFDNLPLTYEFADLGFSPPSNSYLTKEQLNEPEVYYPLKLYVSERTYLVQIEEYKQATDIFNSNYAYFSSYSTSWLAHSKEYVEQMIQRFSYDKSSQIVEIASNDGYLLQYFKEHGIPVLGIEPTSGTAQVAIEKGIETWIEFFGEKLANRLVEKGMQADLLLGNNVLAHVPDINDFVIGLKIALKPKGVITMEFPHLLQLITHNQFDTIYHEHFSYFSLLSVNTIFEFHGLTIFDVQEIPTHGGSLRIFAKHRDNQSQKVSSKVEELLNGEREKGMNSIEYYEGFQKKINEAKNNFIQFLISAKKEGKSVAGYGAAAKGNTLLNYCGIKQDLIDFIVDANPNKQNKYAPGSHIPILSEPSLRINKPDYVIIFPWNIKDEIIKQLSYIKEWGAQFVIAIPTLRIIKL
jgi:SAM-dependent methyltransferase